MLEKICNNHMYTTIPKEEENEQQSFDEFVLDIIEDEEEKIQRKIDEYNEEGGY